MPFLPYSIEEDEENKNAPQNISGTSTSFKQPSGSDSGLKPQKSSSGQFTNIQKYIEANQSQAQEMGTKLAQDIEDKASQSKQEVMQLGSNIANTQDLDPTQYLNNPSSIAPEEYQKLRQTGGYEGPEDLSKVKDIDSLNSRASRVSESVNALETERGRNALLQKQYERPDYTKGQRTLDTVLVSNDDSNRQQFNSLRDRYSNIGQLLGTSTKELGDKINQNIIQAQANREKFAPAEQQAWDDLVNPIQERVDEYNLNRDDIINQTTSDIQDDRVSQATLDRLGITPDQLGSLYNLDLNRFLTPDLTQATLNNLANQQERERYQALRNLIGDSSRTEIGQQDAQLNPIGFDLDTFKSERDAVAKEYSDLINSYDTKAFPENRGILDSWLSGPGKTSIHTDNTASALQVLRSFSNTTDRSQIIGAINVLLGSDLIRGRDTLALIKNNLLNYDQQLSQFQPNRTIIKE